MATRVRVFLIKLLIQHKNIDIFVCQRLTSDYQIKLYEILGCKFLYNNRKTSPYGGVAIYVSLHLDWKERDDLIDERIESIFIEIRNKNLLIYEFFNVNKAWVTLTSY